MNNPQEKPPELLQGYTLLDRLGAGGYGEVWRAQAPGGLMKAVKYVFGRQDETRANAELKALERIKSVRHPFLLSLERIEILEGRLIVVTELADGSLRDRYQACLDDGLPGIPRDELLGYLRDAADALDFLNGEHQLQHLDIKPENLLLLAGHVKVADFGLVKSVSQQTQSLVGGMTPTYAAPEVFQGRPSERSDQYSLAILFQELLTGTLPFPGSNVAELTLQHLNEEPNLDGLAEGDRYVLSRALAKAPEHRFDSCGEMVRGLVSGESMASTDAAPGPAPRVRRPTKRAVASSATEVFEGDDAGWAKVDTPILIDVPAGSEETVDFRAVAGGDAGDFAATPSLFIGIGGAAGRVLRTLRSRFEGRFAGGGVQPSFPMLLLDTDAKALTAATSPGGAGQPLAKEETISLALRRPQDYREKSPELLTWLGRRWLYNIPRSLQTEGIRPLGRLALIDHARQTFQRIRRAMAEGLEQQSLEATRDQTGLALRQNAMRVYVCASISGGAGGGMSLDVAYAAKSILKRLGVEDAKVIGVMMHSTSRDARGGELACVNAYSWLSEYHHLCQPGVAYPGDVGSGLPGHEPGVGAFDDAYLVDLGAGLDTIEFDAATRSVADYLFLDAVSPAQGLLDECRRGAGAGQQSSKLNTFSVTRQASAPAEVLRHAESVARGRLLASWAGAGSDAGGRSDEQDGSTNPLVHGAPQVVGALKLDSSGLASLCRALIDARLAAGEASSINPSQQAEPLPTSDWPSVATPVLKRFGCETSAPAPSSTIDGAPLADLIAPLADKLAADLSAWVIGRVDTPRERVAGARRAINWFSDHLAAVRPDLGRLVAAESKQREAFEAEASGIKWSTAPPEAIRESRLKLQSQAARAAALEAALVVVDRVAEGLLAAEKIVIEMADSLERILFAEAEQDRECDPTQLASLEEALPGIVNELRERIDKDLLPAGSKLSGLLRSPESSVGLRDAIFRLTEMTVAERLNSAATLLESAVDGEAGLKIPSLAKTGSTAFQFVVQAHKAGEDGESLEVAGNPCAEIVSDEGAAYWCVEAQNLSVPRVAAELVGRRRDYAALAERVHTRRDIEWADLTQALIASPAAAPAPASDSEFVCTQPVPLS